MPGFRLTDLTGDGSFLLGWLLEISWRGRLGKARLVGWVVTVHPGMEDRAYKLKIYYDGRE